MLLGRHTRSVFFEALPALTSCLAIMHIFRSKFAGPSLDICYTTRYGAFGHRFPCSSAVCFQAFTLRHSLLRQHRKTCGLISPCTEQDTALQPSVGRGAVGEPGSRVTAAGEERGGHVGTVQERP